MNAFGNVQCEPNSVFLWSALDLPQAISQTIHIDAIPYTPFQLHSLVIAAFASLVAPFGGFYASAFKRSINAKDFSSVIPGHGGLTDRFDCQFLMGLFSYVYYTSLIREHRVGLGSVMETVVTRLSAEDQVELYRELARYLKGQGKL
ncbi:phosphatidate cytidylyltransferase [Ceraceosorus bombacis]|uniref:Phosphatidate cytidylyltransferase n=1 Tax=Ceraceosorus bombacis TaxID=401625 RepID=A0A0P1A4P8_9BASI|nr:phosphatidate cytidylyltransferase [Ceraceosorus bombacis]